MGDVPRLGQEMALIRKVLVMSLKSQIDEHFLAATKEDHPPF